MKKCIALLCMLSMTAALLTGCGSSEDTAPEQSGNTAEERKQLL